VGTVQEVTEVWQMMRIREVPPRPFVLYGAFWQPLVDMLVNSPYVGASEMTMIQQAHTPEQVLHLLGNWNGRT
jgi:predicted Rossmann-fold nucleotide-binding protein